MRWKVTVAAATAVLEPISARVSLISCGNSSRRLQVWGALDVVIPCVGACCWYSRVWRDLMMEYRMLWLPLMCIMYQSFWSRRTCRLYMLRPFTCLRCTVVLSVFVRMSAVFSADAI